MRENRKHITRVSSDEARRLKDENDDARLDAMTDADVAQAVAGDPDAPPLNLDWTQARLSLPPGKDVVTLRLDRDVLNWFRAHGNGYQTRINQALRAFYEAKRNPLAADVVESVKASGLTPNLAKIDKMMVGESLVGDGNEVAHIDLIIGPRGSAAESAFANALTNKKNGFTSLLAVVAPNLPAKPATVMFNKVTIKGAKQAVQMFGPAQHAVARAVADSVADGTIPAAEADDVFICVGVFIHRDAADDKKIHDFNYRAVKEAIERAVNGKPTPAEVVSQRDGSTSMVGPGRARKR
jgi:5,6,7,8-tetrahydromethanopterin hydro-lyase